MPPKSGRRQPSGQGLAGISHAYGPGVRRHGKGWQACVKYRGERTFSPTFPFDAKPADVRAWKKDARDTLKDGHSDAPAGTLAADIARYLALASVKRMPTFKERQQQLEEWAAALGTVRRRKVTALMIEEQRDRWLAELRPGRTKNAEPKALSAGAVNKRLRALSNVWAKLDGRRAVNPVREVAECEEPDPVSRGLPYDTIEAILSAIPDTFTGFTKDQERTPGKGVERKGQTKARLRVMAYTGLAQAQLKLLTKADVDLDAGTMRVVARRKGRTLRRAAERALPQLMPLIPQAVEAFREFDRRACWGTFSNSSMRKAFARACEYIDMGKLGLRPYDLRHSFGSLVYSETRDLRTTGALLTHRSERTTRRYTIAAVAPHIADAIAKVRTKLAADAGAQSGARAVENVEVSVSFEWRQDGRHSVGESEETRETVRKAL